MRRRGPFGHTQLRGDDEAVVDRVGIARIGLRVSEIDDKVVGVLRLGIQLQAAEEQVGALETVQAHLLSATRDVASDPHVVGLAAPHQVRQAVVVHDRRHGDYVELDLHRRLTLALG